jgi:hypothetical protein
MTQPKWTEDRTAALVDFVGDETPVSQETVAGAAESLDPPCSTRSISSKLRKMDYVVELASAREQSKFTDLEGETLAAFVTGKSGEYTYAQIAAAFAEGKFNPKSIQGKILSMELTSHVAPAPKPEVVRTYTPDQEVLFVKMVNDNAYVEDIAKAMDKEITSVRGKALSLLRTNEIANMPVQQFTKGSTRTDALADLGDVTGMTVAEIAVAIDKTERGVKTMLTRRGLTASDYDGAARKAKAEA